MKIDLISRKAIVDMLQDAEDETFADAERTMNPIKAIASGIVEEIKNRVIAAPAVDAVQVVHGRWIHGVTLNHEWRKCSECLVSQEIFGCFTYCPNCGAKMDGGASE